MMEFVAPPPSLRKSSLRIEDLSASTMNGFQSFPSPNSPPSANTSSPVPGLLSPTPNGVRKLSSEHGPPLLRTDSVESTANSTHPPASENSGQWSSAVGHASTGKSGRVIERLMSENDKLKRDLNAQVVKCQELEKSLQTYKPQMEKLREENDNLTHARGVDSSLISRRDRKIEELKGDLASERQRREKAESMARQREREKDDIEEQKRRDMLKMTEETKHATISADILQTSHRQLSAEYRARAETWQKDLNALKEGRAKDKEKLARLDVVTNQMRHEMERSKKLNSEIIEAWDAYRELSEQRLRGVIEEGEQENERTRKLSTEMDQVVNQMRWVMGVKENVKDAR